jgi:rod shape-determining protein MreD
MRSFLIFAMLGLSVILQMSLLPALRPFGVVPNLVLVVVVLISLHAATSKVLLGAIVSGFVLDLANGTNFGLWTGILMLIALVVGLMHRAGLELHGVVAAAILVATGTLTMTIVIWLSLIVNLATIVPLSLIRSLTSELVLNLVLMILLRHFVRWALVGHKAGQESEG